MLRVPPPEKDDPAPAPPFPTRGRDEDEATSSAQGRQGIERSAATTWAWHECVVWRQQLPEQP